MKACPRILCIQQLHAAPAGAQGAAARVEVSARLWARLRSAGPSVAIPADDFAYLPPVLPLTHGWRPHEPLSRRSGACADSREGGVVANFVPGWPNVIFLDSQTLKDRPSREACGTGGQTDQKATLTTQAWSGSDLQLQLHFFHATSELDSLNSLCRPSSAVVIFARLIPRLGQCQKVSSAQPLVDRPRRPTRLMNVSFAHPTSYSSPQVASHAAKNLHLRATERRHALRNHDMVQQVYLPNGQIYTITPVFGGFTFKSTNQDLHHSAMPPGWTVVLQTEDQVEDNMERRKSRVPLDASRAALEAGRESHEPIPKHTVIHRFTKPTVQGDSMFISSISIPSSTDFKNTASPTRHIAMMLWATLSWYFHKEAPSPQVLTEASALTPESGRPKVDWRIKVKREGIFKGKNTLQKLERMGLISSEDSSVGTDTDVRLPSGWAETFVSRRSFWQIDARIFLYTMAPQQHSPFPQASPYPSRPSSPDRTATVTVTDRGSPRPADYVTTPGINDSFTAGISSPGGPFNAGSHLPTFYPPHPTQFTFTNHIRHPIRSKPPRQGETFYNRYIPSVGQWLSFRVPTLSPKPCPPPQFVPASASLPAILPSHAGSIATLPTMDNFLDRPSDLDLLHKWMNDPRVNAAWGVAGPQSTQHKFLVDGLQSRHSFPVYGCWDGKPFGYFEIYWVKEDKLGRLLGGEVGNYTRGLHVLIGENEFRGPHRVKIWLSALVHYCFLADYRTETVMLEPRVDNTKFIGYLGDAGFYKQGEVTFPHKQSAVMKIDRESWEAPEL